MGHERDHVLTKGDTLRSQDTLRSHTPRTPMQRDSHRHGHRNTRSHQSSAIHTPDVHDHSAMELDGTLTRSPSRTGGTDHEASGNENVEPQIREREKALRDVSRVLSLTQHLPEQKAKRSTHVKEMDGERARTVEDAADGGSEDECERARERTYAQCEHGLCAESHYGREHDQCVCTAVGRRASIDEEYPS